MILNTAAPSMGSDDKNHDVNSAKDKVKLRPVQSNGSPRAIKMAHGKPLLLGYLIKINNRPAIAYMKGNNTYAFVYLDELMAIVFDGTYPIPEYILEAMSP